MGSSQVKKDLEASVPLWKLFLGAFASITSLKIGDPPALRHHSAYSLQLPPNGFNSRLDNSW